MENDYLLRSILDRATGIVQMRDAAKKMESRKLGVFMADKYALMAVRFVEELAKTAADRNTKQNT